MKPTETSKKKTTQLWLKVLAVVVVLIAFIIAAVVIGIHHLNSITSDGTKNFSGIEKQAAQNALVHINEVSQCGNCVFALPGGKLQVVKVTPNSSNECHGSDDPNNIAHYDVTVKSIEIFGIHSTTTWRGCILAV